MQTNDKRGINGLAARGAEVPRDRITRLSRRCLRCNGFGYIAGHDGSANDCPECNIPSRESDNA